MEEHWTRLAELLRMQEAHAERVDSVVEVATKGNPVARHRDDKIVIRGRAGRYKVVPYLLAAERGIDESVHATVSAAVTAARDAAHHAGLWAVGARFGRGKAPAQPLARSFARGDRRIDVVARSIAALGEPVDAIVSSDDNWLTHGGGVSRAIWDAAGDELDRFVVHARPSLSLGQVFVTPAGRLQAQAVIHAVTIDFDENRRIAPGQVASLYRRVLAAADEREFRSVATPLLALGTAGVDTAGTTRSLEEALDSWLATPTSVHRIVVATVPQTYSFVEEALSVLLAERGSILEVLQAVGEKATGSLAQRVGRLVGAYSSTERLPLDRRGAPLAALLEGALQFTSAVFGAEPSAGAADPSGASSAEQGRLDALLALAADGRLSFSAHEQAIVSQGLQARTRLVHARSQAWSIDDVAAVALATRALLSLADGGMESAPLILRDAGAQLLDETATLPTHGDVCRASDQPPLDGASEPVTVDAQELHSRPDVPVVALPAARSDTRLAPESGTSHVRALQQFLQTYLDASALQDIDARLSADGYAGSADAKLLEYCLRVEDPVAFVASEFSRSRLATAYQAHTGRTAPGSADARQLAEYLLEYLGFPLPRPLGGLAKAREVIEQSRVRVATSANDDGAAVTAAVMRVAAQLECICLVLLRFLCRAAYDRTPEELFQWLKQIPKSSTLEGASLGKLITLVEDLDKQLARDPDAVARLRLASIDRQRLFPENAGDLARVRNSFAHFKPGADGRGNLQSREAALAFLEAARTFIQYLRAPDTRLFPLMVRVTRIEVDSWGRRRVHARDDEAHEEVIFTDVGLEPGRVYFMQPLSNPVRVDPILVPAGDLAWPEA